MTSVKTLIIYEEVPESTKVFLVDGDHSDLQGKYGNTVDFKRLPPSVQDRLRYPEKHFGKSIDPPLRMDMDTESTLVVVVCGFIL